MSESAIETNVVVVGSGVSRLAAALEAGRLHAESYSMRDTSGHRAGDTL